MTTSLEPLRHRDIEVALCVCVTLGEARIAMNLSSFSIDTSFSRSAGCSNPATRPFSIIMLKAMAVRSAIKLCLRTYSASLYSFLGLMLVDRSGRP